VGFSSTPQIKLCGDWKFIIKFWGWFYYTWNNIQYGDENHRWCCQLFLIHSRWRKVYCFVFIMAITMWNGWPYRETHMHQVLSGNMAAGTYKMIKYGSGEENLCYMGTNEWFSRYKNGTISAKDEPCPCHLTSLQTGETAIHFQCDRESNGCFIYIMNNLSKRNSMETAWKMEAGFVAVIPQQCTSLLALYKREVPTKQDRWFPTHLIHKI